MSKRLDAILSALLTLAGIAVALVLVHREFFGEPGARGASSTPRTSGYDSDWSEIVPVGLKSGSADARIKIIEFADLECPYCARFNATLAAIRKKYPNDVAVVFVHFPLSGHRFARPAARAVECADEPRRFPLIDLLYSKQDSIGLKSWVEFGLEAGVSDTVEFKRCVTRMSNVARVEAGVAVGKKFAIIATPTVFVNGWRYAAPPDVAELSRIISSLLRGKPPFADTGTARQSR
jgi:protein-disulfide isomerase